MKSTRILLALAFLAVAVASGVIAADHAFRAPTGMETVPASSECPAMKQQCPAMKQACPGIRGTADPAMAV